jgi:membrane-associated phospholipid phosphatase
MKKLVIISVLGLLFIQQTNCQTSTNKYGFNSTVNNIYKGFQESVTWYDIPIGIAYLSRKYFPNNNIGDIFNIPPTNVEKDISSDLGRSRRFSLGSIDKDYFPYAVFFSRFLVSTSLNLFTNVNITSDDYKRIFVFYKSLVYTHTLTEYIKGFVKRERPDGSDTKSFISGHTSTTFATVTFLYRELNDIYDNWTFTKNDPTLKTIMKISTFSLMYGWAGYVGYSRIRDNKHYLTDVIGGAAVGTLISYFLYDLYFDDEPSFFNNFSLGTQNNNFALSFNVTF